ncbi:hypothetical protein CEXT_246321 [Caerostris extrusa]|uniref:Uncharacterized protein n=1 Tax=Caerostris extrusa TaxID=172846 RepID=A0AAV4R5M5_CAEEX|nr:hypothetical protein CEXT_246321 [Caerostris extrusa]
MYAATSTISQPQCREDAMRHCYWALATLFRWVFGGKEGRVQTRYGRELWWTRSMLLIKPSLSTLRHGSQKDRRGRKHLQGAVDKVKGRSSGAGPRCTSKNANISCRRKQNYEETNIEDLKSHRKFLFKA